MAIKPTGNGKPASAVHEADSAREAERTGASSDAGFSDRLAPPADAATASARPVGVADDVAASVAEKIRAGRLSRGEPAVRAMAEGLAGAALEGRPKRVRMARAAEIRDVLLGDPEFEARALRMVDRALEQASSDE